MRRLLLTALLTLLVGGCATSAAPPEERHPSDPWEPFNRSVWTFNTTVDRAVLRPVARGYDRVTPEPVQGSLRNFFANIKSPVVFVNAVLQGRADDAGEEARRFITNTLFGVAGLFDVATAKDIGKARADFGQTMASWGWEESRFLMLPFLGPSTVRDGMGSAVDTLPNLEWRLAGDGSFVLLGLNVIQTRADLLPLDAQLEDALDPYAFMRDGWMQRRAFLIHGDDAPLPDYDAMLDEGDW